MNSDVTVYIENIKPWQQEMCTALRQKVHDTVTGVEEILHYGKPHFSVDGKNIGVLHAAPAKVLFMVFDAGDVEPVPGLFGLWAPATARSSTSAKAKPSIPHSSPTCCAARPAWTEREKPTPCA